MNRARSDGNLVRRIIAQTMAVAHSNGAAIGLLMRHCTGLQWRIFVRALQPAGMPGAGVLLLLLRVACAKAMQLWHARRQSTKTFVV